MRMQYVRGNKRDYDQWASWGNIGWSYENVLPFFKKSENARIGRLQKSTYHGTSGGLTVEYAAYTSGLEPLYFKAGQELNILNKNNDYNGQSQMGMSEIQETLRDGVRCSANKAFLRPAKNRPNFHVSLNSFVTKIDIDPVTKQAKGVFFTRDGHDYRIAAQKEVILSAGSIKSPQILMLSGVGAAAHLQQHNISVINDLPGVGENLHDHVAFVPFYTVNNSTSTAPVSILSDKVLTDQTIEDFVHRKVGLVYAHRAKTLAFINTKYQDKLLNWPDVQCNLGSTIDPSGVIEKNGRKLDGYLSISVVLRPRSRGHIRLNSNDSYVYPLIDPNYFADDHDLDTLVSTQNGIYFCSPNLCSMSSHTG